MIYIIKDCQTQLRLDNIVVGRQNVELNSKGKQEAKVIAEQLKGIHFDTVYCSPLIRCDSVADIVCPEQPLKYDDRIIERKFGMLEGKEILDVNNLPLWKINHISRWNCEHLADVRRRAVGFLKEKLRLLKFASEDKNILIITHNSVIACMREYIEGKPKNRIYTSYFIKNTQVLKYNNKDIKDIREQK